MLLGSIKMSENLSSLTQSTQSLSKGLRLVVSKNNLETESILVNTLSLDKLDYQEFRDWTNLIRSETDYIINKIINPKQVDSSKHLIKYRNLTLEDLEKFIKLTIVSKKDMVSVVRQM